MPDKMKILVTGEKGLLREGLHRLLEGYDDIDVIGEAADGKEAWERACELQPDVVIIDCNLKTMNGIEVTRRLTRKVPRIKVIILTDRDTRENVVGAFVAGACGCVPMATTGAELASAARAVYRGEMYLHPSLSRTMVNTFLSFRRSEEAGNDPYEQLTEREKHVLKLIAEGHSSREIARELGIVIKTVMGHTACAMKKLGIHHRSELVRYAIRKSIVELESRS